EASATAVIDDLQQRGGEGLGEGVDRFGAMNGLAVDPAHRQLAVGDARDHVDEVGSAGGEADIGTARLRAHPEERVAGAGAKPPQIVEADLDLVGGVEPVLAGAEAAEDAVVEAAVGQATELALV